MAAAIPVDFASSRPLVPRPGLRVVIFEHDPVMAARLEVVLESDSVFVRVGSSRTVEECEFLLREYVPEILICRREHAHQFLQAELLPTMVLLLELHPRLRLIEKESRKEFSLEPGETTTSLMEIKTCVLERKAAEILRLMEAMRNEVSSESLQSEDVLWVDSDRNYLVLHTKRGPVRRRGTLSSFLDSSAHSFIRVSRSRAVQRAHIHRVAQGDHTITIMLKCGTALPVSRSCQRHIRKMYGTD